VIIFSSAESPKEIDLGQATETIASAGTKADAWHQLYVERARMLWEETTTARCSNKKKWKHPCCGRQLLQSTDGSNLGTTAEKQNDR
jgi:hypothetical protein